MFLPDAELGAGLSVQEYAHIAELTGRSLLAPTVFNCNAPDSGNMELLWRYGSEEQKQQWLSPLLAGEIRSVFCMTEPAVASSDATNMQATAVIEGDEIVLNGCKWWSSGLGDPNAKVIIFMAHTPDDSKDRHHQHSMVLVPIDTAGVTIERMLPVLVIMMLRMDMVKSALIMYEYHSVILLAGQVKGLKLPRDVWDVPYTSLHAMYWSCGKIIRFND